MRMTKGYFALSLARTLTTDVITSILIGDSAVDEYSSARYFARTNGINDILPSLLGRGRYKAKSRNACSGIRGIRTGTSVPQTITSFCHMKYAASARTFPMPHPQISRRNKGKEEMHVWSMRAMQGRTGKTTRSGEVCSRAS